MTSLKRNGGFTMVEIAFSLAIVAFALVAIMGVLPTGMTVQKDNREDTLINNDAVFWAEALRSGSRGLDDLTNYVEEISITNSKAGRIVLVTNTWDAQTKIFSGQQIIGLLSTPKHAGDGSTNYVTARVRAINGPAVDKFNPKQQEFAFRYRLEAEVAPVFPAPADNNGYRNTWSMEQSEVYERNVASNLNHLRLTFRWPIVERGAGWTEGNNRRVVRTLMLGQLPATEQDFADGFDTNYFVAHPNTYQYVTNTPPP